MLLASTLIYPVLSNDILNYDKMGKELDKVFNACKDKTREWYGRHVLGTCTYVTKKHMWEEQESTMEDVRESRRGTTGHDTLLPCNWQRVHGSQVWLKICWLLISQGAINIKTFSDTSSEYCCHGSIRVDPKNSKDPVVFGLSLPLGVLSCLKTLLPTW